MPGLCINQTYFTAAKQKANPSDFTYPFWPKCVTFRLLPYLFLIHLIPCCWGSIIRGQRAQCVRIVAFSVDILSLGSPSLLQAAIVASSVNMAIRSRPSVIGMETLRIRVRCNKLTEWQSKCLRTTDKETRNPSQENTCKFSVDSLTGNKTLIVTHNWTREAWYSPQNSVNCSIQHLVYYYSYLASSERDFDPYIYPKLFQQGKSEFRHQEVWQDNRNVFAQRSNHPA